MATSGNDPNQSQFEGMAERLGDMLNPIKALTDAMVGMYDEADKVNRAFVAGRMRMDELMQATSRAAAGVIRLGGDISDVSETMIGIAEGSKRSVIATEEQVSKLYAASKILGKETDYLVESFANIGYETSQIGPNLEKTIAYVQSVGGNTKTVTKEVLANMEQMNRYQFEGGVQGLAKMAAQASMLRFDMSQTFNFTNKMLTPENAVNMAAAFQRLGVAAGNLVDPFALMNQSINDPTGLQNSLARLGQQFTYFDEETQSFKINPQGVLTLRQMEEEAGLAAGSLSKSALAAAELDKRVSQISPSLNFKKEEDKQLLANMATMQGGEYVVQIKDDQGTVVETKKLSDVTQEEFDKLREQQEKAPKTLEEIQKSQLDVLTNIEATLKGNISKLSYGVVGSTAVSSNVGGAERLVSAVANATDATIPESRKVSEKVDASINKMLLLFKEREGGSLSQDDFARRTEALEEEIKQGALSMGDKGIKAMKEILARTNANITGKSSIENKFREITDHLMKVTGTEPIRPQNRMSQAVIEPVTTTSIFGKSSRATSSGTSSKTTTQTESKVDLGGTLTIKVETPPGVSQQYFSNFFNSEEFKRMVYKYYNEKAKELERR